MTEGQLWPPERRVDVFSTTDSSSGKGGVVSAGGVGTQAQTWL